MPSLNVNDRAAERIRARHPWLFKSDILEADEVQPGEIVSVLFKKKFLAWAFFNPRSQIVRIISTKQEPIDDNFWKVRFNEALSRRPPQAEATRLVFSESDFIPGLIVDRYREVYVLQTLTAGIDRLKGLFIRLIQEQQNPQAIVERNDPAIRTLEGLTRQQGILWGNLPDPLEIREGNRILQVDPLQGHKTGLYLDQATNHLAIQKQAQGRILDLFCYQGGFSLQLADRCEEVIAVDDSAAALSIARQNLNRNEIRNVQLVEANVFDYLHTLTDRGDRFDMILLDPPPFASRKEKLAAGQRGYKEINLRAMKLLKSGGILVTCSCSQNFTESHFYDMLLEAAEDTHRTIQVLEKRGAAEDHPVLLTFPESFYLQCWILRVL